MADKTLADLDLRRQYGINVVSIRSPESSRYTAVPDPQHHLKEGEILVVAGTKENVQHLREAFTD